VIFVLFVFILCFVFPIFPGDFCFVCLHPMFCVPNRQTKQKSPDNIGNTKHRMKTNKTKTTWQYWEHKT
jgi:hypothetical protein